VPRVKYAMNYRPKNSFSMSYPSRKVIFPGVIGNIHSRGGIYIKSVVQLDLIVIHLVCLLKAFLLVG